LRGFSTEKYFHGLPTKRIFAWFLSLYVEYSKYISFLEVGTQVIVQYEVFETKEA